MLAIVMLAVNVPLLFSEQPITEGQRIYENFHHAGIEGGGEIRMSHEDAMKMSEYIHAMPSVGEYRLSLGMICLGLLMFIYSSFSLWKEYNKALQSTASGGD